MSKLSLKPDNSYGIDLEGRIGLNHVIIILCNSFPVSNFLCDNFMKLRFLPIFLISFNVSALFRRNFVERDREYFAESGPEAFDHLYNLRHQEALFITEHGDQIYFEAQEKLLTHSINVLFGLPSRSFLFHKVSIYIFSFSFGIVLLQGVEKVFCVMCVAVVL